jgi:hypothetical protein
MPSVSYVAEMTGAPLCPAIVEIGSHKLFAWAGLEL